MALDAFMTDHRLAKGDGSFTHTSMGGGGVGRATFRIEDSDTAEFHELYADACFDGGRQLSLIEFHKPCGPILYDCDCLYGMSTAPTASVVFTDAFLQSFLQNICRVVPRYVEVCARNPAPHLMLMYVMRKPGGPRVMENGRYKEGLHVVLPNIVTTPAVQRLIREELLGWLQGMLDALPDAVQILTKTADVLDESVIERNGWMMYGSCKPDQPAYGVHSIWRLTDGNIVRLTHEQMASYAHPFTLLNALSIRQCSSADALATTKLCSQALDTLRKSELSQAKNRRMQGEIVRCCEDLSHVQGLVKLLSSTRSDSYEPWIQLGRCLHNIDWRLFGTWVEFSMLSDRYSDSDARKSCNSEWRKMASSAAKAERKRGLLGMGSLVKWAQEDNADNCRYKDYMQDTLEQLIVTCCYKYMYAVTDEESGGAGPPKAAKPTADNTKKGAVAKKKYKAMDWHSIVYYVVAVLHKQYKHQMVCSSPTKKVWWEYKNHRWSQCELGLKKYLNDEVFQLFTSIGQKFNARRIVYENKIAAGGVADVDDLATKVERNHRLSVACWKLADNMRHTLNKETTMREAAEAFYWQCNATDEDDELHERNFEEVLDSDTYLIGMKNGVYDLRTHEFREGRCEDYIRMSTKNRYSVDDPAFSWEHPDVVAILAFCSQVLPDPQTLEYILLLFASFCDGEPAETFHIFVGTGGNGKSKLIDLLQHSMGEYCGSLPVTALTGKRPDSNAPSPELERLKGKRVVAVQEPNQSDRLQVGRVKELTGGDVIYARGLHKEAIEYKPQFNLVLASNVLPKVPADDGGIWRRMKVVIFTSKFKDDPDENNPNDFAIDDTIKFRLPGWGPGFFWLLMQKYKQLHTPLNENIPNGGPDGVTVYGCGGKLNEPPAVKEATLGYHHRNDTMMKFVTECVDSKASKGVLLCNDLYQQYTMWSKGQGQSPDERQTFDDAINFRYGEPTAVKGAQLGWRGKELRAAA